MALSGRFITKWEIRLVPFGDAGLSGRRRRASRALWLADFSGPRLGNGSSQD